MIRKFALLAIVVGVIFYLAGRYFIGDIIAEPAPTPTSTPVAVADAILPTATAAIVARPTYTATMLPASAPVRINFPVGSYGTTVEGSIVNGELDAYQLWAREGQVMKVFLSSQTDAMVALQRFDNGAVAWKDVASNTTVTATLPYNGDYIVSVYGGSANYKIAFEIR